MIITKKRALQGLDTTLANLDKGSDLYKELAAIRCRLANAGNEAFKDGTLDYESPPEPNYFDFYFG